MELNRIINDDCLNVMKQIPDKYFDLCLTDPPYGINVSKLVYNVKPNEKRGKNSKALSGNYKKAEWDMMPPSIEYFNEIKRISKNQIIFGGNYFAEWLGNSSCWLFWDKLNGTNDFADGELAWTSFKSAVRKYEFLWNGMLQQNMKNKEKRIHPTQKPVGLFSMILRDYSKEGDKIFDPFSGSGTTAIACHRGKRQFLCVEKDEVYFQKSVERLEEERKQMILL